MIRDSAGVTERTRQGLAACWTDTTNAGGAVGFPWPPVTLTEVLPEVDGLVSRIDAGQELLVVAAEADLVAGWVSLRLNESPLVAHWATVRHLQTHPTLRGRGLGSTLILEVANTARDDSLQQLQLAVRGGMGLEDFYARLGWQVVGRWPHALRLAADDYRDEVLMALRL